MSINITSSGKTITYPLEKNVKLLYYLFINVIYDLKDEVSPLIRYDKDKFYIPYLFSSVSKGTSGPVYLLVIFNRL